MTTYMRDLGSKIRRYLLLVNIYEEFASHEEAEQYQEAMYRNYHPAGYGTHIAIVKDDTTGRYICRGYRYSSCD
jgi:hypothetical protein